MCLDVNSGVSGGTWGHLGVSRVQLKGIQRHLEVFKGYLRYQIVAWGNLGALEGYLRCIQKRIWSISRYLGRVERHLRAIRGK